MKILKLENFIGSEIALEDLRSGYMYEPNLAVIVKGQRILLTQENVKELSKALIKWLPEEKELNPYVVNYDGLYTGGCAIVMAESDEEAKNLVQDHHNTINFKDVDVFKCKSGPGVIYNDNGDM